MSVTLSFTDTCKRREKTMGRLLECVQLCSSEVSSSKRDDAANCRDVTCRKTSRELEMIKPQRIHPIPFRSYVRRRYQAHTARLKCNHSYSVNGFPASPNSKCGFRCARSKIVCAKTEFAHANQEPGGKVSRMSLVCHHSLHLGTGRTHAYTTSNTTHPHSHGSSRSG